MIRTVCVLGRQPALGLAELESLYGAERVVAVAPSVAGLNLPADAVDFARLGGSTRLAGVLGELPTANWKLVEKELQKLVRSTAFALPTSGKFHLGLSALGFDLSPAKLNALGLTLKKVIRSRHDGSVRLVPNVERELSSAQVFHNHLTDEHGAELLIIASGNKTIIARTIAVQDIDSYTMRDRGRPKRDARVGMLPPKLAQNIINLAAGEIGGGRWKVDDREKTVAPPDRLPSTPCILDPFCGTGVVLQEAMLMGYDVYGTDLEPRMIDYTQQNLDWLCDHMNLESRILNVEVGDATTHKWDLGGGRWKVDDREKTVAPPDRLPSTPFVACEAYLGRPFTEQPDRATLEQTVSEVNTIIKKFLQNIHPQLPAGARLCLAVPAWHINARRPTADGRFRHLPVLDDLQQLGFERLSFTHASAGELIYHREGQFVGRELVTLKRK